MSWFSMVMKSKARTIWKTWANFFMAGGGVMMLRQHWILKGMVMSRSNIEGGRY